MSEQRWRTEWLIAREAYQAAWSEFRDAVQMDRTEKAMDYARLRGLCARYGVDDSRAGELAQEFIYGEAPWCRAGVEGGGR